MSQVRIWESLGAYLADLDGFEYASSRSTHTGRDPWAGGITYATAVKLAREGDDSLVAAATDAMSKVRDITEMAPRRGWSRHVQGARVHVPSYVANSPACFSRRVKRERDTRHVRIFVNTACGSGVEASAMMRRGATILGLVEALQACQVHVEAYVTCDGLAVGGPNDDRPVCHAIKLDDPLNLSVQGFALAHVSMARRIMYSGIEKWGRTSPHGGIQRPIYDVKIVRDLYKMTPDDVYVPWAQWRDELIEKPEEWLKARISQIIGSEES